jgi:hypothetical protein
VTGHDAGLETRRLRLTPLDLSDAGEMVSVLGDDQLYFFTGGRPPTCDIRFHIGHCCLDGGTR